MKQRVDKTGRASKATGKSEEHSSVNYIKDSIQYSLKMAPKATERVFTKCSLDTRPRATQDRRLVSEVVVFV